MSLIATVQYAHQRGSAVQMCFERNAQGLTREPWKPELAYSSLMLQQGDNKRGRGWDERKDRDKEGDL
jgi:hypothetical protein